jgi:hypothetical protein
MRIKRSYTVAKWSVLAAILAVGAATTTRAQAQGTLMPVSTGPVTTAATTNETSSPLREAAAVDTQALSTVHLAAIEPVRPVRQANIEKLPPRKSWLILSLLQHGAAGFDAYSTRQAIANGAVEEDPFMRPFANSPAIYGAIQIAPLALDYVARRMQLSHHELVRHLWWLPQTTSTGLFLFSGAHNMHVAGE